MIKFNSDYDIKGDIRFVMEAEKLNSAELSAKTKISELESDNKRLMETNESFLGPRCLMPYPNHRAHPCESFYFLLWH